MITDRRIKYTKMVLKDSLIKLMKEKPISRISIKAICEDADINRATYYSHYKDQYDQLNQIEMEFIDGINAYLDSLAENAAPENVIDSLLQYILENRELCCTLLSPNGDMRFEEKVSGVVRDRVFAVWKVNPSQKNTLDDYIYTYTLAGCVGIVIKWLNDGDMRYSPQQFGRLLYALNVNNIDNIFREKQ
ncbi:MAG: TetR-like C-terminal domain-containing protein [Eubacteriales bacterium]|nr:TetR-like C-terminal domain-containing protein [Eubacteriales bacterium]